MKSLRLSILAILLSTSHLYGETSMATTIDVLITQTDETALANTAQGIAGVYEAVSTGELHSSEANAELFRVISADVIAASAIYAVTEQAGQIRTQSGDALLSAGTAGLIAQIQHDTPSFSDRIAPEVSENINAVTYLKQMGVVNGELLSRSPAVLSPDKSMVENFKSYQLLVSPIERALGYTDYNASFEREDYWPNGDYFQGNANFINLFRGSDAEKAKSLKFMAYFDGLSPTEQLVAYAWVYDADFETYLSIAPVLSDLPPWITSESLRTLHRTINDAIMAEFEDEELEMMQ